MKPAKISVPRPSVRPPTTVHRCSTSSVARTTQFTNEFHSTPFREAPEGFTSKIRDTFQNLASKFGIGKEQKTSTTEGQHEKGKQGFASMPKEKVQEIASKGGQASRTGSNKGEPSGEVHEKGKQGFASMPKEQVQEIASKGGQASHKGYQKEKPLPGLESNEQTTAP